MDWQANDDQLLIIDGDEVEAVDNLVMSITEIEIAEGTWSRTVMLLVHKHGSAPDAVDYTLQLSSHAVYQLFASMSINLPELIRMKWLPEKERGDNGG